MPSSIQVILVLLSVNCHLVTPIDVSALESVATCGLRSNAACGVGIWKHEKGQRVSRKIQMSSGRFEASFQFRESFVIHHLQHFSVQFCGPS